MTVHYVDDDGCESTSRLGSALETIKDRRVWRLFVRGVGSYTRAFPEWFKAEDVRRRCRDQGVDLIDAEPVT